MPRLTIDGQQTDAAPGATILEAAEAIGIEIPALCRWPGIAPRTSCMLCVVQEGPQGRMLPSCSARAEEGMEVRTHSPEIAEARRDVLQLLVGEHTGDCEAPCRRTCPAALNIPYMLRLIQQGDFLGAARVAKHDLVIPVTLGHVCTAPCEKACRRRAIDESLAIREMHRRMAVDAAPQDLRFDCAPDSGRRVAVVGSGASGLAAAWRLRGSGHACTVFDTGALGGALREFKELPAAALEAELDTLRARGVEFELSGELPAARDLLGRGFDAVVLALEHAEETAPGIFWARTDHMPVRGVHHGKAAAAAVDHFLRGEENTGERFDSRLHRLHRDEALLFAENRIGAEALARGQQPGTPVEEAERCLHCDCLRTESCKLRRYATEYGAKSHAHAQGERLPLEKALRGGGVYFESGKCIRCGLCIEIARREGEALGLAMMGRGFNVHVATPFGAQVGAALNVSGPLCAEACPTGAIALIEQEENHTP